MPGWRAEFPGGFEVPGFIEYLVRKKLLLDMSWHNDTMPSFGLMGIRPGRKHWDPRTPMSQQDPELDIRLWVDHPFKEYREVGGKRFSVMVGEYGTAPEDSEEFDELDAALAQLFQFAAEAHSKGTHLDPQTFSVTLEEADNDWEELLNGLISEYHTGGS